MTDKMERLVKGARIGRCSDDFRLLYLSVCRGQQDCGRIVRRRSTAQREGGCYSKCAECAATISISLQFAENSRAQYSQRERETERMTPFCSVETIDSRKNTMQSLMDMKVQSRCLPVLTSRRLKEVN